MKNRTNNRGQMSVIGLIFIFIMLILLSALMPTIVTTIANTTGVVDSTTGIFLNLIPLCLVVSLVMGIFVYAKPVSGY
jgi:uncharacterized membrane protein